MKHGISEASYALFYSIISRATLVIINLMAARFLPVEDYGILSYFLISVSSVAALSATGVGVTCNFVAARYYEKDPRIVSATLTLSLLLIILLAAIFSAVFSALTTSALASTISSIELYLLFFVLSLMMTTYGALEGILYGLSRFRIMFFGAVIIMTMAVGAALGSMLYFGLVGAGLAVVVHRIFALSIFAGIVRKKTAVQFSLNALVENAVYARRAFFKASLPIAVSAMLAGPVIAIAINSLERSTSMKDVAAFAIVYQFFLIAVFIPASLSHFLLSKFSKGDSNKAIFLNRSIYITFAYGICAGAVFLVLKWPLEILIPNIFIDFQTLVYFAISLLCYSVSTSFLGFWPSVGRANIILLAQIAWAVAVIGITFLMVNTIGGQAISLGLMLGSIGQLLVHFMVFLKYRMSSSK